MPFSNHMLHFSKERKKLHKAKMQRNDDMYHEGRHMLNQLREMMEVLSINRDPSVVDEMQEMWRKLHKKKGPEGNQ